MLLLTSTSDLLRVVTGSTGDIEVHASWMDNAAGTVTPGRTNTASITTATTTTVVASPAASTQRNVKHLNITNNHATTSNQVSVEHTDGTNVVELMSILLLAGENLTLDAIGQWTHYDADGLVKLEPTKLDAKLYVTADSVHATAATFAVITGLQCTVKSGRNYCFEAHLFHISNATTTGAQFAIGGVAMTGMIIGSVSTVLNSATASTHSSGVATAVNTAPIVQTTGAAANAPTYLAGWFQPSADGTFEVRATSEVTVASALTVRKGSFARIWEVDN